MKRKWMSLFALIPLLAAGCDEVSSTSTSTGTSTSTSSTTTSSSSSSSSSSVPTIADVLAKLQSDELAFSGTLTQSVVTETQGSEAYVSTIEGYASASRFYNAEYDETGALAYLSDYVSDEEGYVATAELDPYTNTVEVVRYEEGGENLVFADYFSNPFLALTEEDLTVEGTTVTFDVTEQEISDIGYFTTLYTDIPFDTLTATIDADYNIVSVELSHVETGEDADLGAYTLTYSYLFELVDPATLDLPAIEPRPDNAETQRLQDLFEALQEGNYTVDGTIAIDYGGGDVETYVTSALYTADGILLDSDILPSPIGYLAVDGGVAEVVLEGENLVGQGPVQNATFADVLAMPTFGYDARMFDVSEDGNTYTLASGLGISADAGVLVPDPLGLRETTGSDLAIPDDGSLSVTFQEDGSYLFRYTETLSFLGMSIVTTAEMEVSAVNETALPYGIEDYVPYANPTSWAEVDGIVDEMAYYGIDSDLVPWYCPEGAMWEYDDYMETYILSVGADMLASEAADAFGALLVEAGWVLVEEDSYGECYYSYTLQDGTILNISLWPADSQGIVYFYFYDPETPKVDTALSLWIEENFLNSSNYTMDVSISYLHAPIDQETGEQTGEITIDDPFLTAVYRYTDEAAHMDYDEASGMTDKLFVNRDDGTASRYEVSGGSATLQQTYEGNYQSVFLYTMMDVALLHPSFVPVDGVDGGYTTEDANLQDDLYSMIGLYFSTEGDTYSNFEILFDEASGELTIGFIVNLGYYYADSSQTTIELGGNYAVLSIGSVGTTTIDPDLLALVEA